MQPSIRKHTWTKKQTASALVPNYSKLYVIRLALLKLIPTVRGKKILELGCGNGFWLRLLSKKGAICTGIDKSKNQIEAARKENKKINYYIMDAQHLTFRANTFDIVFLEKVLLEIPKLNIIKKIIKEAYRVTKKGGTILVSDLHPIAPQCNLQNVRPSKGYYYFKSGAPIQIVSKRIDGKETNYTDYHWTFEDLMSAITNVGFKVVALKEPKPSKTIIKKYPYLYYRKNDPLSLIIKGMK